MPGYNTGTELLTTFNGVRNFPLFDQYLTLIELASGGTMLAEVSQAPNLLNLWTPRLSANR